MLRLHILKKKKACQYHVSPIENRGEHVPFWIFWLTMKTNYKVEFWTWYVSPHSGKYSNHQCLCSSFTKCFPHCTGTVHLFIPTSLTAPTLQWLVDLPSYEKPNWISPRGLRKCLSSAWKDRISCHHLLIQLYLDASASDEGRCV